IVKTEDAVTVKRLKDAGAIILGKTNTPTLCFSQETTNKLYGRTNNPWNVKHTVGGSSGGEGALISTGASAVGLASDIGGSIRLDRKSTRLNSSHVSISYAVFCLK